MNILTLGVWLSFTQNAELIRKLLSFVYLTSFILAFKQRIMLSSISIVKKGRDKKNLECVAFPPKKEKLV